MGNNSYELLLVLPIVDRNRNKEGRYDMVLGLVFKKHLVRLYFGNIDTMLFQLTTNVDYVSGV